MINLIQGRRAKRLPLATLCRAFGAEPPCPYRLKLHSGFYTLKQTSLFYLQVLLQQRRRQCGGGYVEREAAL